MRGDIYARSLVGGDEEPADEKVLYALLSLNKEIRAKGISLNVAFGTFDTDKNLTLDFEEFKRGMQSQQRFSLPYRFHRHPC